MKKIQSLFMRANEEAVQAVMTFPEKKSDPAIADVIAITQEMFRQKPTLEVTCDPSEPTEDIVILNVRCAGTIDDLIEKEIEWGDRVAALEPRHSGQLRLNVVLCK